MNAEKTVREPLPRGFWVIWSTVALDMVGFGIVAPILGRYADRYGANGFQVGLLFASFSLAQMVFSPILGRWSDRVGRKPVIVISLIGTAIGSFITGAAGALWVLFAGRLIDGASGASVSVAQSAIADLGAPKQRARMLGMLGMAFGVGFVVGPALGGLAALGGPHVPFYVAGVLASINAVAAIIRLPETKKVREEQPVVAHVPKQRNITSFVLIGFFSVLPFAGFEATFSLFGGSRFNLTEAVNGGRISCSWIADVCSARWAYWSAYREVWLVEFATSGSSTRCSGNVVPWGRCGVACTHHCARVDGDWCRNCKPITYHPCCKLCSRSKARGSAWLSAVVQRTCTSYWSAACRLSV